MQAAIIARGRAIREAAGLTLREVAADLGVTDDTLGAWETGARVPQPGNARRWAALLAELTEGNE
jgi:transcriptional regulator with XRE-family HTH domain